MCAQASNVPEASNVLEAMAEKDRKRLMRAVSLHWFLKGSDSAATQRELASVYGEEDAPDIRTVQRWFTRFREEDYSLEEKARPGRPVEVDNAEILRLLEESPNISTQEIADKTGYETRTIRNHLKQLGFVSKLDVWVPHALSAVNKQARLEVAREHMDRLSRDPFFLDRIVTGDEKWILYSNVLRSRSWRIRGAAPRAVAKPGLHPRKVLLSVWWDVRGVVFFELLRPGETINSAKYCEQLTKLDEALRNSRSRLANRGDVVFHHDNARPHTARETTRKLTELGWEIMRHPPYSPDMAPSDYHLFQTLQNELYKNSFNSITEVETFLRRFFESRSADFYRKGIHRLRERWQKIIEKGGDYV